MPSKNIIIYPAARKRIKDIRYYTSLKFGKGQAGKYITGLYNFSESLLTKTYIWRKVDDDEFKGIYYVSYESHYIFFRELGEHKLGIISVLHHSMDMPNRLRDDV